MFGLIHDDDLAHGLCRLHRTLASSDAIDPLEADEFQIGCLGPLLELYGHAPVALAAGFSDQPHLTLEFGRTLGMTPGQYVAIRQR